MIRKPLQTVDNNVQRNSIPIFDDFKVPSKTDSANVGHSAKKAKISSQNIGLNKLLVAMLIVQQKELKLSHMKTAFLKLANNALAQRSGNSVACKEVNHDMKHSSTPRKRRFEENGETEVDDGNRLGLHVSSTPPRLRSNTSHTPHSSKRVHSTPSRHQNVFNTPGRAPLQDATNREINRSVFPEQKGSVSDSPKKPAELLSERLQQVEDSLKKLQVLGDLETVRAAAAQLKSPIRNRVYEALRGGNVDSIPHDASAAKENQRHSEHANRTTPVSSESASINESIPIPGSQKIAGTGSTLLQPQLAEHLVLQASIQRATRTSMKTLLKSREALPRATESRDQLLSFQLDSERVVPALKPSNPDPAAEAAAQASLLETSIAHYHHASSGLYPLSPLGDQSIRGAAFAPVPLSELSLLRDKMQSWRSKYAIQPAAPP